MVVVGSEIMNCVATLAVDSGSSEIMRPACIARGLNLFFVLARSEACSGHSRRSDEQSRGD